MRKPFGVSSMHHTRLSACGIFLLYTFCTHLCFGANPAGVESVTKVTPEDFPRTMKNGDPAFEVKLRFPQVSLGRIHTQIIQVRNVPENAKRIPTFMVLGVPAAEDSTADWQPWRLAKCKIEMKTPEGKVFYSEVVDLAKDWRGLSRWDLGPANNPGRTIEILPPLPRAQEAGLDDKALGNYDIVVHVISASRRATDSFKFPDQLLTIRRQAK
ncbi:hypothetical protein ACXR0O_19100 [Verrucomicrobiota bacterium sgz303538]